jgi:hypothetical protein
VARPLHIVLIDDQCEIVGYADGAFYFETGAGVRNIAHDAIDPGCLIKRNRPGFQDALTLLLSMFIHGKKGPAFMPEPPRMYAEAQT